MDYDKQTWVNGESPLNAHRMNHMEDGIKGASADTTLLNAEIAKIQKLAKEYDVSEAYFEGDIVIHNGIFYRCIVATSGPWAASSWEELTLEWIAGNSDKSFTYHNDQGQDTWVIDHNLGKKPSVTIVADADEREVIADIEYVDDNRVIIHFQGALNGSAYLN